MDRALIDIRKIHFENAYIQTLDRQVKSGEIPTLSRNGNQHSAESPSPYAQAQKDECLRG